MWDVLLPILTAVAGSLVTAAIIYAARLRHVPGEVEEHDRLARDRNDDLETWVADDHGKVEQELRATTTELSSRNLLYSGQHGSALSNVKKGALHRYRDQERQARRYVNDLAAREGWAHAIYRRRRNRPVFTLPARERVQPILDRWRDRKWMAPPGVEPPEVEDPTHRTIDDVIAAL